MDAKQMIAERRSVGSFNPSATLAPDTLREIIELALHAPSGYNLQPWRLLIIQSDEAKENLFNLAFKQPKVKEASVNILLIANRNGWDESNPVWNEMLQSVGGNSEIVENAKAGAKWVYGSSEEMRIKFSESNTALLAMSIMYAAAAFGVDTHPMNGFDFDGIKREFGLAEHESPVMNIAMGYRDESKPLHPRRPRRSFNDIASII